MCLLGPLANELLTMIVFPIAFVFADVGDTILSLEVLLGSIKGFYIKSSKREGVELILQKKYANIK